MDKEEKQELQQLYKELTAQKGRIKQVRKMLRSTDANTLENLTQISQVFEEMIETLQDMYEVQAERYDIMEEEGQAPEVCEKQEAIVDALNNAAERLRDIEINPNDTYHLDKILADALQYYIPKALYWLTVAHDA